MQKVAAIVTNMNPQYSFFAPFTALMWTQMGYRPYLLFLSGEAETPGAAAAGWLAVEETRHLADEHMFPTPLAPGVPAAEIAMVVRFCAAHFVESDSYWMTTDIDLWPLDCSWWNPPSRKKLHILASDAYVSPGIAEAPEFAACGIGACAGVWSEITGFKVTSDPAMWIAREYASAAVYRQYAFTGGFDQGLITKKIKAWPGYPDQVEFLPRGVDLELPRSPEGYPAMRGRICRLNWRRPDDLHGILDAHLPRPGFSEENWPLVRELFLRVLPARADWADDYHARYLRALGGV